jgi:hypothetical protein
VKKAVTPIGGISSVLSDIKVKSDYLDEIKVGAKILPFPKMAG